MPRVVLALPDRHAFRGERPDGGPLSFAGRASFSGIIACTTCPRAWLAARLPRELELAPSATLDGAHPVVVVFGEHQAPALLRMGLAIPLGAPYGELGIMVPYVRGIGRTRLATYVWRMCSTYFPAVWEGNMRYFAKAFASMSWHGPQFVVTDEDRRPIFHALVSAEEEWRRGASARLPVVEALADAFTLPIVGRPASSRLACSNFGWDLHAASVRPATVTMSLDARLLDDTVAHELHAPLGDAIAVRDMPWRLGWPAEWSG